MGSRVDRPFRSALKSSFKACHHGPLLYNSLGTRGSRGSKIRNKLRALKLLATCSYSFQKGIRACLGNGKVIGWKDPDEARRKKNEKAEKAKQKPQGQNKGVTFASAEAEMESASLEIRALGLERYCHVLRLQIEDYLFFSKSLLFKQRFRSVIQLSQTQFVIIFVH